MSASYNELKISYIMATDWYQLRSYLLLHNQHLRGAAGNDEITYISMEFEIWRFHSVAWIVQTHVSSVSDTMKKQLSRNTWNVQIPYYGICLFQRITIRWRYQWFSIVFYHVKRSHFSTPVYSVSSILVGGVWSSKKLS